MAGDLQHTVNVEISGAQNRSVPAGYRYRVIQGGGFVGKRDSGNTVGTGGHPAFLCGAVGKGNGNGFANGQRPGNVHSHIAVQRKEQQRAPVIDDIGNGVALFGINHFYPSGGGGLDVGGGIFGVCGIDVAVKLTQYFLQLGYRRGNADPVHGSDGVAFGYPCSIVNMQGGDFHGLGNLQVRSFLGGQGSGAGKHRGDGAFHHGIGQHPGVYLNGFRNGRGKRGYNQRHGQHRAQSGHPQHRTAAPVGEVVLLQLQLGHGVGGSRLRLGFSAAKEKHQENRRSRQADCGQGQPQAPKNAEEAGSGCFFRHLLGHLRKIDAAGEVRQILGQALRT